MNQQQLDAQEEHNRLIIESGVPAPPSEQTTTFADAPSYALNDAPIAYSPPIAWSSDGDMPSENPVDIEDIVMFDHDTPPAGVPFMENGIYALMDETARARLWMPVDWEDPPLFAEPTPGPTPAPNPPAANPPAASPPAANSPAANPPAPTDNSAAQCNSRYPEPSQDLWAKYASLVRSTDSLFEHSCTSRQVFLHFVLYHSIQLFLFF